MLNSDTDSKIWRNCLRCENLFLAPRYLVNRGGGKYCSRNCSVAAQSIDPVVRFWKHVDKDSSPNGCWLWTGHLAVSNGYPMFAKSGGRPMPAYRFSYEIHNGSIPDGLHVLHTCPGGDNPRCVNPAHLRAGTHKENMQDMVERGRSMKGKPRPVRPSKVAFEVGVTCQ